MQGLAILRSYLWIVKLSISEVGLRDIVSIDILLFHVSEYFELLLMLLRQWRKWDLMIRSPFHRYRIYQNYRVANHSQPLGDKQREKEGTSSLSARKWMIQTDAIIWSSQPTVHQGTASRARSRYRPPSSGHSPRYKLSAGKAHAPWPWDERR